MSTNKRPPIFYGWVIVAVSFLIALVAYGVRFSFPAFYVSILEEFGTSRSGTAGPYSLNLLIYGTGAVVIGILVDRFGPVRVIALGSFIMAAGLASISQVNSLWLLFPLFGFVVALGHCMAGNASFIPVLSNWFVRRRGLAIGMYFAGVAGSPVLAPLVQHLIDSFGWRGAYLVIAVAAVVFIAPAALLLLRARPSDKGLQPDGATSSSGQSGGKSSPGEGLMVVNKEWAATNWNVPKAIRTRQFWALFLMNLCMGVEVNLIYLHQMAHAVDIGYSKMFAASVFGLVGFMVAAGSYAGFICDRIGRELTYTVGTVGSIVGILMLTLSTDAFHPWMLYLYAICFGLFFGLSNPAMMASQADLFAGPRFGSINGLLLTGFGIGGALGPYFGGLLFDVTGSYVWSFSLAMAAVAAAGVFMWVASPRKIRLVPGMAARRR